MEVHFRMRARLSEGKDGAFTCWLLEMSVRLSERGLKPLQSS